MSVITAKNNYTGLGSCGRMNCSQSVASAFKDKFNLDDEFVESFGACGGGRAPSGMCGAFYAAKKILEKLDADKIEDFMEFFRGQAGALECTNIKGLRKLSCVGCVEKSSEYLEKMG
jgi:hypothetical protein